MSTAVSQPGHSASGARRSFFAATHLFGQYVLLNIISLPVTAFIIRQVGKSGWGDWGTASTLAAVAMLFTNLGLRGTFVRFLARNPEQAEPALAEQLGIRLPLCFISSAMVLGTCYALHYSNSIKSCAVIYCVWIFLNATMSTLSDLLQGLQRMSVFAAISFISGATLTGASAVIVWLWPTAFALSLAYMIGPITTILLLMMYLRRDKIAVRIRWKKGRFAQMWHESRFMAAQQIINTVGMQLESLVLPAAAGSAVFGLFYAGLTLASRLWMIPDSLSTTFYPLMAQAHSRSPEAASEEAGRSLLLSLLVCLPVAVAVIFFAAPVSLILMSKSHPGDVAICQQVICITIWALPLWAIESMMGFGLNAAHRDNVHAKRAFYSVIVSILVGGGLIWKFGLIGACWSYILRVVFRIAFVSGPFHRTFPGAVQVWRLIRLAGCGLLMGGAMWAVQQAIPNQGFFELHAANLHEWIRVTSGLFVEGAVGSLAYVAAIFGFRVFSLESLKLVLRRASKQV
jgi:O-antigen/teichoic acid export membrane protein